MGLATPKMLARSLDATVSDIGRGCNSTVEPNGSSSRPKSGTVLVDAEMLAKMSSTMKGAVVAVVVESVEAAVVVLIIAVGVWPRLSTSMWLSSRVAVVIEGSIVLGRLIRFRAVTYRSGTRAFHNRK